MYRLIIFICAQLFFGCVGNNTPVPDLNIPNSTKYEPFDQEEANALEKASKSILPFDVLRDLKKHQGKFVVWTGIVDTIVFQKPNDTTLFVDILLQHRYYDFIEDHSAQQERMFVSPLGENEFLVRRFMDPKTDLISVKADLNKAIFKECFLFCYGNVYYVFGKRPMLLLDKFRIVFPENYATNIFSYKAERSKDSNIVIDEKGYPNLVDFKMLRISKQGRNQLGSRLKNSKD